MVDLDKLKTKLLNGEYTGLSIECNMYKTYYETAADTITERSGWFDEPFTSPEEKQKCIDTNTIWTLQWYPDTPVGFVVIHAASFAAILDWLDKRDIYLKERSDE